MEKDSRKDKNKGQTKTLIVYHHLSLTVKIMKVKITTQSSWKSHLSRIICKYILNLSTSSASNASNMEYRTISDSSDGISPGSWSNFFHKLAFFFVLLE